METVSGCSNVSIIDIRRDGLEYSLLDEIREKLDPASGQERRMPTLLLYDERGLKLFEDITYLDEYYLTNSEIEVLGNHADEIARHVQARSMVVELGSGYDMPAVPVSMPSSFLACLASGSKIEV